mmetsp:Transcript_123317/g.356360  ORF Transcript_123317/g.356360 Transcript_123317/m.356360 type:complete len:315 (-) Transcript_123317:26-970(-)
MRAPFGNVFEATSNAVWPVAPPGRALYNPNCTMLPRSSSRMVVTPIITIGSTINLPCRTLPVATAKSGKSAAPTGAKADQSRRVPLRSVGFATVVFVVILVILKWPSEHVVFRACSTPMLCLNSSMCLGFGTPHDGRTCRFNNSTSSWHNSVFTLRDNTFTRGQSESARTLRPLSPAMSRDVMLCLRVSSPTTCKAFNKLDLASGANAPYSRTSPRWQYRSSTAFQPPAESSPPPALRRTSAGVAFGACSVEPEHAASCIKFATASGGKLWTSCMSVSKSGGMLATWPFRAVAASISFRNAGSIATRPRCSARL